MPASAPWRKRASSWKQIPPYDAGLWRKLADQGFTGIIIPEEFGGMGLGMVELILLMEEAGYALLPGPLFSTLMAGAVLNSCGSAGTEAEVFATHCLGGRAGHGCVP